MGIAVKTKNGYQLLTGNQTVRLCCIFLPNTKPARKRSGLQYDCYLNLAGQIAERYGLLLSQTLTGFKFIGAEAKRLENRRRIFLRV